MRFFVFPFSFLHAAERANNDRMYATDATQRAKKQTRAGVRMGAMRREDLSPRRVRGIKARGKRQEIGDGVIDWGCFQGKLRCNK